MIISNQKDTFDYITIRDLILTKVSAVKFLGDALDENLTFNDHVNKVTTKISKLASVMTLLPVALLLLSSSSLIVVRCTRPGESENTL